MNSKLEKILIIKKTTKYDYLIEKYGLEMIKQSDEYQRILNSREIQIKNSDSFIEAFDKRKGKNQFIKIITDSFHRNDEIVKDINSDTYDYIYSLGGDGTFLRAASLVKNGNPVFIGVNTDKKRSVGHYCSVQIDKTLDDKMNLLMNKQYIEKRINKVKLYFPQRNYSQFFINDLFFSEKNIGRVANYKLYLNRNLNEKSFNNNQNLDLALNRLPYINKENIESQFKSSGIIFSTYSGYSGWIRNANNISLSKYESNSNIDITKPNIQDILNKYIDFNINNDYILKDSFKNKIFYYINESSIFRPMKGVPYEEIYAKYKLLEGCVDNITLKSFCYEGNLIIDGSFQKTLDYGEEFELSVIGNDYLLTIEKMI